MKEWIITLHNKNDLESFYEDMETPGGQLYIPGRAVQCSDKRPISRNTHYMLEDDEVDLIRQDPRVWDLDLKELIDFTTKPAYKITNGDFAKDFNLDSGDTNWGLLRHVEELNRSNWGDPGTSLVVDNVEITSSGKNVDVVIVDGHIDPAHPEFAVNPDGTGGSRVVQENWFSHGGSGTYVYDRSGSYTNAADRNDNNHGCHCGGTVAGNTQGWARDANVYNISPYGTNPNGGVNIWDYMREWHNTKPINPITGRKNPTISNHSYGSSIEVGYSGDYNTGLVTRVNFRGVDFNPGRDLTAAELQARGFYASSQSGFSIPNYFTSRFADIQDAIDDGIIVVCSAGNDAWKTVKSTDQDYNNSYYMTYNGSNYFWYLHRGTGSGAGFANAINVGAMSNNVAEDKAIFSNCGSQVDIFAAGEAIQSSLHSGYGADARNSTYRLGKYQGTSMSGPQVAGVLAILAQQDPNMTQTEAQAWLDTVSTYDEMFDTEADDPMDTDSLQGAPNKILRWINQRPTAGKSFPVVNFKPRPTASIVWPRGRVRKRG
ncbi:MAG: S8 family serine peptidase [Hellea sp.]|nr:S8 family serine peptidase [Hellea sp.]